MLESCSELSFLSVSPRGRKDLFVYRLLLLNQLLLLLLLLLLLQLLIPLLLLLLSWGQRRGWIVSGRSPRELSCPGRSSEGWWDEGVAWLLLLLLLQEEKEEGL